MLINFGQRQHVRAAIELTGPKTNQVLCLIMLKKKTAHWQGGKNVGFFV